MLDKGEQEDWFASALIVGLTIAGAVGLVAFVIRERARDTLLLTSGRPGIPRNA